MKTAKGIIKEIIVVKLQRGDELITGIRQACIEHGVKNGVIISLIGSLINADYIDSKVDLREKCGTGSVNIHFDGPVELLSGQGEICHKEDGELFVHIHATISDTNGNAYGGHIIGESNMVLNTINAFIGVIDGVDMGFERDDVIGMLQLSPKTI